MHIKLMICLVLFAVTLGVFWQVHDHAFISYDDPQYVTENPRVTSGLNRESAAWAFTAGYAGNWHPVTWLSHMTDCQLYGLNPAGHHLTNLFFHLASTVLLFLVLARITGAVWQSCFVAALFALHPLHVESVAWVAERKDVLSGFFWMLTLLLYARYVERPGRANYLLVLAAFSLGLMAKPMLVTLPFVLLLLDYWPLGRMAPEKDNAETAAFTAQFGRRTSLLRLLREKLPFFVLSLVSCMVTYYAQHKGGAVLSVETIPFAFRAVNAVLAYVGYIAKMFWPHALAVIYPLSPTLTIWQGLEAALLLTGLSFLVVWASRRSPFLLVGWLWYLGTLVPVIGLVQVGHQSMADRYTYIPLIGLFIMVAWGVPSAMKNNRWKAPVLAVSALTILSACAACSWLQLGYWKNSIALFSHAAGVVPDNYEAQTSLGVSLAVEGRIDEAAGHFMEALRITPDNYAAHFNLGLALAQQEKTEESLAHFGEAVRIEPNQPAAYIRLGSQLGKLGRLGEAADQYSMALQIDPGNVEARYALGMTVASMGNYAAAAGHIADALRIAPGFAEGHYNLGVLLVKLGKVEEGQFHFREALRIDPSFEAARKSLGTTLQRKLNRPGSHGEGD